MTDPPCGCRRGFWLCADAQRLWAAYTAAYLAAQSGAGTWEAVTEARREYDAHFEEVQDG